MTDATMLRVFLDITDERRRQDAKWGEQNHDLGIWALVHDEEWGEFSHDVLHWRAASGRAENVEGDTSPDEWLSKMRHEAVQTAAVMVAIIEYIDRGMRPTRHRQQGGGAGPNCAGCGEAWPCAGVQP